MLIALAWLVSTILVILTTPREKIREAMVIFMFKQLITWSIGLAVVELGLIEYPVRLFPNANKTSFTFEYYVYPMICVVFNLHYPENKSRLRQLMHYVYFCSVMSLGEHLIEKYTELITYIHWEWYTTWITLFLTFFLSRQYYRWFYRLNKSN
ncbi:MAG TPA: CBO0543 family protein [Bacillota bacterium]|nr:CBO0543 family protein [Bacillota bacterium]